MRNRRTGLRILAALLTTFTAGLWPGWLAGQPLTEGYDPMRQITAQLVKANLLIVQDVSGSMTSDKFSNDVGLNMQGRLSWESTLSVLRPTSTRPADGTVRFRGKDSGGNTRTVQDTTFAGGGNPGVHRWTYGTGAPTYTCDKNVSGCPSPAKTLTATEFPVILYNSARARYEPAYRCKPTGTWSQSSVQLPWEPGTYLYENDRFDFNQCTQWSSGLYFSYPSRMMNVKNAMGNSVYIADEYTPPNPELSGKSKWKDVVWEGTVGTHVAKVSTAAGDVLTVTEAYKSMNGNTLSYRFDINAGFDLSANGVYNPAPTSAVTRNLAVTVNWMNAPTELFPAYHTTAPATYLDVNGNPVRSPGLTSTGAALAAGNWAVGWPADAARYGTVTVRPPNDVVGRNRDRINFGLVTFEAARDTTPTTFPYLFPIDTYETNNVDRLEGYFAASKDPLGNDVYSYVPKQQLPILTTAGNMERVSIGLGVGSYTPTKNALAFAKSVIRATFDGGTLAASNKTWTLPADPKKDCKRTYGVVLVTDGLSNYSNPTNKNWMNPCNTLGTRNYCDVGEEANDCPRNWTSFAAQAANDIYTPGLTQPSGGVINPRVWAIGISPLVGPCELDFIAYMGRTDASSPSGDAGFGGYDVEKNPRLPDPAVGVAADPVDGNAGTYDGPTGNRYWSQNTAKDYRAPDDPPQPWWPSPEPAVTGKGHNAFFANDAGALGEAFAAIVNATATGDYATNAPVSGMSAQASEMVFLPSTVFPTWQGRLYAFDTTKPQFLDPPDNKVPNPAFERWEAGKTLKARSSDDRKIFTWDPTSRALVEVTAANLAVAPLKDVPGLTAQVVDFIRGNDGSGTPRAWRLGPMINSAPAIVAAPSSWTQNKVADHKGFQVANGGRDSLIWVGANDGMMHAFRSKVDDPDADPPQPGLVEQIALIPPGLLWKQVTLYNNFVQDPDFPSGQPPDILEHVYGVANSFRFGDAYDKTAAKYRTIGIVTLGGGGSDIVAMDVTSIPRPDASDYPASPVTILWTKTAGASSTATTLAGLKETWSIPAMAPVSSDTWRLVVGSGFNPTNTAANQIASTGFLAPRTYVLDPVSGDLLQTNTLTSLSSPAPFVGNQAFADSVLFDPRAKTYQDDNLARVGLQADLNGQIWALWENSEGSGSFDKTKAIIDVSTDVAPSQSQPLYYNPAASGYGVPAAGCVAYAFGSGALYERSSKVTGSGIGTSPNFVPRVYVATHGKTLWKTGNPKVPAANIKSKVISSAWTVVNADNSTKTVTFGKRTQLTAPAFALVPRSGSGKVIALFLLYDPDNGCNGFSYVAKVEFEGGDACVPGEPTYTAYEAGVGAASGFTIAGDKVLVSKSGIGEGQRASLYEPPNISASVGSTNKPKVKWWKELK